MSSEGRIVLPLKLRERDRIKPGDEFLVARVDRGEYLLVRLTSRPNEGVVDWLLSCPKRGFFVPIESESTNVV
jgi:bifunctional DNA-binding transcriptional regulator/antitoxin component of YhaV-PrlF toxin-antitoxin module